MAELSEDFVVEQPDNNTIANNAASESSIFMEFAVGK